MAIQNFLQINHSGAHMYQRNLMICLLSTLFWLMVTAEPKNASAQTPGTPSKTETKATNQSPKAKDEGSSPIKPPEDVRAPKGEMAEAKGLLWLGIQIIGLLAVLLIGLLIWLIGRSWSINNLKNALDDRPNQAAITRSSRRISDPAAITRSSHRASRPGCN